MEWGLEAGPERVDAPIYVVCGASGILPLTFEDIFDNLLEAGLNLNSVDENSRGVLCSFLATEDLREDSYEFFRYLMRKGLDVMRNREEKVRLICESFRNGPILRCKFHLLHLILSSAILLRIAYIT